MTEPTVALSHATEPDMTDLEAAAHSVLSAAKQRRFRFLLEARNKTAFTIATLTCWGFADTPRLDHQLVLFERGLDRMIDDPLTAAALAADWARRDSELLHEPGTRTWCPICRNG